ncbi:3-oxoacyl-ACP synthase III family protein [Limnovirga soli]|uniref:Beta-ketoacyl-[acyl-carrier-protein] synthase III n=1 Tax=Limnovirga soli TaxID=2656915 RepID=A0A8J8FER1_9BACT|nr:beta-ketoacyl-ACP synthase III [Limnovirga soli]NNV56365.1 beta-ketoacyl-ACP synthase III [Limnovirga soli]
MKQTKIAGIGMYVPEQIISNQDLSAVMDTSDSWIRERTGIQERHYASYGKETSTTMGVKAAEQAIKRAGITAADIDFIIFATLSPDYFFPGCSVLLQRSMEMKEVAALDIRNQCSGFVYGLSIADQFIKTGMYKNILVVAAETQSFALNFSNTGRNVSVIFGDGAGAVVLQPTNQPNSGILSTHLHSDGKGAELLSMINPGFHGGYYKNGQNNSEEISAFNRPFITGEQKEEHDFDAFMDGQVVFKKAVEKFPEVIMEALNANQLQTNDISILIPHQANLRISQFIQQKLKLTDEQVFNNIQRYGNTTAASVPIALCEAWEQGKIKDGDIVCLAAFGSGFTWASALLRW